MEPNSKSNKKGTSTTSQIKVEKDKELCVHINICEIEYEMPCEKNRCPDNRDANKCRFYTGEAGTCAYSSEKEPRVESVNFLGSDLNRIKQNIHRLFIKNDLVFEKGIEFKWAVWIKDLEDENKRLRKRPLN